MVKNNRDYDLGLYEKALPDSLTWDERLKKVKKLGYDFLEISIDETDKRLARLDDLVLQTDIQAAIRRQNVAIPSMCLSAHRRFPLGSHDEAIRNRSLDIFKKAVDMGTRLGVRVIQLAGYDVYYEKSDTITRAYFIEGLKECIAYAAKNSMVCAFESMETDFMNTIRKIMAYVILIESPYCQIYPDLGNLTNASLDHGDLYGDLKAGRGHFVAAHLKETIPNHFREIEFNRGHVDFKRGIEHLWNLGVRRFVCECWYTDGQDFETVLRYNQKFLRKYLDVGENRDGN